MDYHEIQSMLEAEILDESSGIQKQFLDVYGDQSKEFISNLTVAYKAWETFEAATEGHRQKRIVAAYIFYAINSLMMSMRHFLFGYHVASGNLMRHAIESTAVAILCSRHEFSFLERVRNNKYSGSKALKDLSKRASRFGMNKDAIKVFQKSQAFYSQYSHPTGFALSSIMMFDGSPNVVLGGQYDEHKAKGYF